MRVAALFLDVHETVNPTANQPAKRLLQALPAEVESDHFKIHHGIKAEAQRKGEGINENTCGSAHRDTVFERVLDPLQRVGKHGNEQPDAQVNQRGNAQEDVLRIRNADEIIEHDPVPYIKQPKHGHGTQKP